MRMNGKSTMKQLPRSRVSTRIIPPWASTRDFAMNRPRPVPTCKRPMAVLLITLDPGGRQGFLSNYGLRRDPSGVPRTAAAGLPT
jgi:hypothetical protein